MGDRPSIDGSIAVTTVDLADRPHLLFRLYQPMRKSHFSQCQLSSRLICLNCIVGHSLLALLWKTDSCVSNIQRFEITILQNERSALKPDGSLNHRIASHDWSCAQSGLGREALARLMYPRSKSLGSAQHRRSNCWHCPIFLPYSNDDILLNHVKMKQSELL